MISRVDHLSDEILNEWLDEAVEPSARAAVEAHLAGCQDCAARLDTLRSLFVRLDTLPDLPPERHPWRRVPLFSAGWPILPASPRASVG